MKRKLIYLAVGLIAISACTKNNENETVDVSVVEEMNAKYQEANDFKDSLLLLMGDIYAGLDSINNQEGLLITPGIGDNSDRRAEIRENLSLIRQRLEINKQMLAELEKKANDANANSTILQRTIAQMKERIEIQDAKIEELNAQLALANETITDLNDRLDETNQQLEDQTKLTEETQAQLTATENEANTVYYIIGSNKELKEAGVLESRFLRGTKVMQGNDIDYAKFVKADKRNLTVIPTNAKKIEVKSLNDNASYEIVGDEKGPKSIKILNPELFWQKTSYLVIETK